MKIQVMVFTNPKSASKSILIFLGFFSKAV